MAAHSQNTPESRKNAIEPIKSTFGLSMIILSNFGKGLSRQSGFGTILLSE